MPRSISVRNPRTGESDFAIDATTAEEIASMGADMRSAQVAWKDLGLAGTEALEVPWAQTSPSREPYRSMAVVHPSAPNRAAGTNAMNQAAKNAGPPARIAISSKEFSPAR